jgi:hypothetical protein
MEDQTTSNSAEDTALEQPTEQTPVEVVDTPETKVETSQTTSEQSHDDKEEEITPENYERLKQKASKLESEHAQVLKANEGYQSWVMQKEDRTRTYLQENGLTPEQVEIAIQNIKAQKPDVWQSNSDTTQAPTKIDNANLDPTQLVATIKEELRQETETERVLDEGRKEFFQAVPEMSPESLKGLSPEDRQAVIEFADRVDMTARTLMQTGGLNYGVALTRAYQTLTYGMEGLEDTAKQEGYYEGLAQANALNNSSNGEHLSSSQNNLGAGLTKEESEIVESLKSKGMTAEKYLKYRS